jgi:predicted  nucleic acid-binding Zn-ribbon protein
MDVQLELLIRLQQVDIKITQLLETIAALPHNLRSLEEKLRQQKLALDQADKAVPTEEARRRRLESDRKDQQQKLIKYRDQSSSVKTNEQFHALQHEIGFVEAEIRRIEDEELTSMIKSESLEGQRAEARKASAVQSKLVDEEKERARVAAQGYKDELDVLQQERASTSRCLPSTTALLPRHVRPPWRELPGSVVSPAKCPYVRSFGTRCAKAHC